LAKSCSIKFSEKLEMVGHTYNLGPQESKASLGYIVSSRPDLVSKQTNKKISKRGINSP
jgi:hypothetical protein